MEFAVKEHVHFIDEEECLRDGGMLTGFTVAGLVDLLRHIRESCTFECIVRLADREMCFCRASTQRIVQRSRSLSGCKTRNKSFLAAKALFFPHGAAFAFELLRDGEQPPRKIEVAVEIEMRRHPLPGDRPPVGPSASDCQKETSLGNQTLVRQGKRVTPEEMCVSFAEMGIAPPGWTSFSMSPPSVE